MPFSRTFESPAIVTRGTKVFQEGYFDVSHSTAKTSEAGRDMVQEPLMERTAEEWGIAMVVRPEGLG